MPFERKIGHAGKHPFRIGQDPGEDLGCRRSLNVHFGPGGRLRSATAASRPSRFCCRWSATAAPMPALTHHQIAVRRNKEDDGVVDGLTVVVQKGAIDAAARGEGLSGRPHAGVQIVGKAVLEQGGRPRSGDG